MFFVVIGMMLDVGAVWQRLPWVLPAVLVLRLLKTVTTTVLGRTLGVSPETATHTGILVSQAGEFGLVLATLGTAEGVLGEDEEQVILAMIIS